MLFVKESKTLGSNHTFFVEHKRHVEVLQSHGFLKLNN